MHGPRRVLVALIGVLLASFVATAWADGKPEVKSTSVGSVTATGATLNGTVKAHGQSTTYVFEYGLSKAYGSQTATGNAGASNSTVPVTAPVAGLQPETTYHFRIVATA